MAHYGSVEAAIVAAGGAGLIGTLSASEGADLDFGSGASFTPVLVTLSQAAGSYGFARLTLSGADADKFLLSAVEGNAVGPHKLDSAGWDGLNEIAWSGASCTVQIEPDTAVANGSYSCTLHVADKDDVEVQTFSVSATIDIDPLVAAVEAIVTANGGSAAIYSARDVATGALIDTDVSMTELFGVGADATVTTGNSKTSVASSGIYTAASLAKRLDYVMDGAAGVIAAGLQGLASGRVGTYAVIVSGSGIERSANSSKRIFNATAAKLTEMKINVDPDATAPWWYITHPGGSMNAVPNPGSTGWTCIVTSGGGSDQDGFAGAKGNSLQKTVLGTSQYTDFGDDSVVNPEGGWAAGDVLGYHAVVLISTRLSDAQAAALHAAAT